MPVQRPDHRCSSPQCLWRGGAGCGACGRWPRTPSGRSPRASGPRVRRAGHRGRRPPRASRRAPAPDVGGVDGIGAAPARRRKVGDAASGHRDERIEHGEHAGRAHDRGGEALSGVPPPPPPREPAHRPCRPRRGGSRARCRRTDSPRSSGPPRSGCRWRPCRPSGSFRRSPSVNAIGDPRQETTASMPSGRPSSVSGLVASPSTTESTSPCIARARAGLRDRVVTRCPRSRRVRVTSRPSIPVPPATRTLNEPGSWWGDGCSGFSLNDVVDMLDTSLGVAPNFAASDAGRHP